MNADRNWERNEPNDRDSRGGSQQGFQFSDAYGPSGGSSGNRIINDIHCKNATFDQQGFPDGKQLLPDEQGGEEGGHERGQWEHGGPGGPGQHGGKGRWEKGGHGGHKGHHRGGPPPEELDANGQPIAGSVDANEMGMNAPAPIDANGNPIYNYNPTTMAQSVDSTGSGADPLIAQLSASNPDVAKVLTDAQSQMTQTGYAALSSAMQQNLSSGSDVNTALVTSIGQLQQLGGQDLAPDVATLQNVVNTDMPTLSSSTAPTDALSAASTTTAPDSTLAQISQADPTMGQFVGALQQAGMSPTTYSSIENTVAQNQANGTDDGSTLQQLAQTLQQNPNMQQDFQVFQQVYGAFQQASTGTGGTGDTSSMTSDASAASSDPTASYNSSSSYTTPTSAAV